MLTWPYAFSGVAVQVAVSCKGRMHEVVAEEMERHGGCSGPQLAEPEWRAVMERSFARVDAEVIGWGNGAQQNASCRCEMQTPKCDHVGSTAVVAVVTPDRIVVANCGDSRAVLCRKGVPLPLSSDHKVVNSACSSVLPIWPRPLGRA